MSGRSTHPSGSSSRDAVDTPGERGFSPTEALSYGWRKYGEHAGQIIVATIVLVAVTVAVGFLTHDAADRWSEPDGAFSAGGALPVIVTSFVAYVIGAVILRGALDIAEGFGFDVVAAFRMLPVVNVVVASLVAAVPTALALAVNDILGYFVIAFMLFVHLRVVDKDVNVVAATRDCVNLIQLNLNAVTTLLLLSILGLVAGVMALCVGALVALPVLAIAWAYAYRVLRGQPVAP